MRIPSRAAWVSLALAAAACPLSPARAAWTPNGSPIAVYSCEEFPTDAVSDGRGGMIVVWMDNRACTESRIYAQRILGSGEIAAGWPEGGVPLATFASRQQYAAAVSDGAGGAIVVWRDFRTGDYALFAQRIAADGTRLWLASGLRVSDTPGWQLGFRVLADDDGGAFVAWMDARRGIDDGEPHHHTLYDLYVQRFGANGVPLWPPEGVAVDTTATATGTPGLVLDGGGGVLVTWPHAEGSTRLQHLRASGAAVLAVGGVTIPGFYLGDQTTDGAGGILSARTYGSDDLFGQRVDSTGAALWGPDGVVVAAAAHGQRVNAILPDGAGGAFIAFYDLRNGQDWDVYAQCITSTGEPAPGWPVNGLAVCTEPGFQIYPRMVPDGAGGIVLTWYDERDTTAAYDIYAQRIDGAGLIAPGWPAGGLRVSNAPGHQTTPLPVVDGSGGVLIAWHDGRAYSDVYALRVSGAGIVGEAEPVVGVDEGVAVALGFGPIFPNPLARGALSVTFALPGPAPARLSLIDARGRLVVTRTVGDGTAGRFTVRLEEAADLSAGVYLLRLEQEGRSVSRKVSLLH